MAIATLQSFNVFLTERLTAAAVDIYGFVEKTIIDYQEEVYQTKLENQRLQRLLDLVYKPEIRLHRADSRQIDLPTPTQEVCAQEQQKQKECIPSEANEEPVILPIKEELTDLWTRSAETPVCLASSSDTDTLTQIVTVREHEDNEMPDNRTQVVTVGKHGKYTAPDSLTRIVTVGEHSKYKPPDSLTPAREHVEYELPSDNQLFPSSGVYPVDTKPFLRKAELKVHLTSQATKGLPKAIKKAFTCFVCGKATENRSQMINHMRTHTNEKPFACHICGKRYKLKCHVKEHLRTHTGERPYTCYICGRTFNRSSTMSKHARITHRESMPFKCMHCSQRFPLLVLLKQHMKMFHNVTVSV